MAPAPCRLCGAALRFGSSPRPFLACHALHSARHCVVLAYVARTRGAYGPFVGTKVDLTRLSEQLVAVVEETMPLAQVSLDSPHPGGAQVLQEREHPVFRTEVTPCYRRNLHTDSGS